MAEFSIAPLDKGGSVSEQVARAVDIIDRSGLDYRLGPMGTCVEGEWEAVMKVLKDCVDAVAEDSARITISFKGDYRPHSREKHMKDKVEKMARILSRPLKV